MARRTMEHVSYGFSKPEHLVEKLRRDGAKLSPEPDPDNVFNFLVTTAAAYEWIRSAFAGNELMEAIAGSLKGGGWESMPVQTGGWIEDRSCLPNKHCDVRHHIVNVLRICRFGAGASKHFRWEGSVNAIKPEPIVGNWYQYFFTSTVPDLYIDYGGEVYGLSQVRDIAQQFFDGLIKHLRTGSPDPDA